jgi:broad specificity phosphatase PhoE
MATLIRHGKKAWANGKKGRVNGSAFDPPLLNGTDVANLKVRLTEKPKYIVCSPFLRCQQTAMILSNNEIPVYVDADLREFLGNWPGRTITVEETTQKYISEPLVETFDVFRTRVLRTVQKGYYTDNIWIVTHGLVIRTLCEHLKGTSPDVPEAGFIRL